MINSNNTRNVISILGRRNYKIGMNLDDGREQGDEITCVQCIEEKFLSNY